MNNLPLPEAVVLRALKEGGALSADEVRRAVKTGFGHEISRSSLSRYLMRLEGYRLIRKVEGSHHPALWEAVKPPERSWRTIGEIADALVSRLTPEEVS